MRCTACGSELVLTSVVPDETARLRGCEHHRFLCSACHATEHRLVFTRYGREHESVPVPEGMALSSSLTRLGKEPAMSPGLLSRVVSWLRR
jgi:hypothetical protein